MAPLLERVAQPAFLTRLVAVILRITAALVALLSLTIFFKVGKLTFDLPTNRVLGGILFEVFLVLAIYATVHVFVIRARDVEAVKPSDTYAISIVALLVKLAGEAYGAFMIFMSLGGGLFVWFTNQQIGNLLGPVVRALFPGAHDDATFMGGIQLIATGVLIGVGSLVCAYATAQVLSLLVRPPRNGSQQFPAADVNHSHRSRFGSGS
ncbi:MAG: hypothetical protein A2W18_14840 [Candidatus Muproteobacteria bacterium RBG_16_60_9]|uniref:Uncharacterized protein n=1 Tax=Candidatus Muproteobacteria bacterium RBG_16_60_9 TaxID=1817755 RepID=A0A1F6V7P0_9PROT|nr:MAG: hypothetical protein A2W18_14840 [Candidatus Muproteobacteria bacterium RBG_16_60_9]